MRAPGHATFPRPCGSSIKARIRWCEIRSKNTVTPKEEFTHLYLPVRNALLRYARAMVRSRTDADDLIADTLLIAFEHFGSLRERQAFLSFLMTIAARQYRRRLRRLRLFGAYSEEHVSEMIDPGPSPETAAEAALLHRALARLPERQRETVVLAELAGLTLEEIRVVQGGSLSGVKSRLVRGRARLALLLGCGDVSRGATRNAGHPVDHSFSIADQKSHG